MAASAIFDRVGGVLVLLLGAGVVWHALGLQVAFASDPVGPKAFPAIVGIVLLVCGASIALRPVATTWEVGDWKRVVLVALAALGYPFVLVPAGFVPATAALGFLCALAFRGRPLPALAGAVALAVAIFVLIDLGLGLGLPRGPLGI